MIKSVGIFTAVASCTVTLIHRESKRFTRVATVSLASFCMFHRFKLPSSSLSLSLSLSLLLSVIRGLDLNFRYPSAWQRNIHRRIATGSQRCGITDQIKNQYFPLKTLRSGPPCRSDITAASFAFNANLTRFRGSSNSDQFFAAAAAIARPIKASHHRCGPFASVVLSLSLSLSATTRSAGTNGSLFRVGANVRKKRRKRKKEKNTLN